MFHIIVKNTKGLIARPGQTNTMTCLSRYLEESSGKICVRINEEDDVPFHKENIVLILLTSPHHLTILEIYLGRFGSAGEKIGGLSREFREAS
jgi:hypothetical protein